MNIADFFRKLSSGSKPPTRYERQVFLVTDDSVRNRCLDMIEKRGEFIDGLMAAVERGDGSLEDAFRKNAEIPPDERTLNEMVGIVDWPHVLKCKVHKKTYQGMWIGEPGAEVVLQDRKVYITMPIPALVEEMYDEPEAQKLISEWQSPAWLEKVDPAVLEERKPIGFPRMLYDGNDTRLFCAPS